jgi:membrane-associated protease RseP (regulator of RpoE activity)
VSDQRPANPEPGEPSPPVEGSPSPTPPAASAAEPPAPEATATPPDEAPTAPIETTAAAGAPDEAPTQTALPAAEATPSPTPVAPAPATADRGRGVFVPAWVAVVAGILLVALLGFAIGWIAAPGDDADTSNAVATQPNPGANDSDRGTDGNGTNGSNGGGDSRTFPDAPDRGNGDDDGSSVPPLFRGAYLGVTVETVENDGGARLTAVADDGPAAEAGLRAGDVVTEVDGEEVTSSLDLIRAVRQHEPDDRITVTYTRDGASADAEVTLSERPTTQSVS